MLTRKKDMVPPSERLRKYLRFYGRMADIPSIYDDLQRFQSFYPYEDPSGKETLWMEVGYDNLIMRELRPKLTFIYAMLKIGGDLSRAEHLSVDAVHFGEFGNSRPFRIRITNQINGNSDHFYVKHADANRLYGLEIEHLLSPNRISYLVSGNTLIEEHIAGVPGDVFLRDYLPKCEGNERVRIAKEFAKFSERCFIRLLGDMRSVNYVVDITPDFENVQYRVRPIDFDQQCWEGNAHVYQSYRFSSNRAITRIALKELDDRTLEQYVEEERAQMARRARAETRRLTALLAVMRGEQLAPDEHVHRLREELTQMHETHAFNACRSMGDITATHVRHLLETPTKLRKSNGTARR